VIALLFVLLGSAEAYTTRICAEWTPNFEDPTVPDDDGIDANGDGDPSNDTSDFLGSNDKTALRGVRLVAETLDASGQWQHAWTGHAPATGPFAGCTDAFATTSTPLGHWVRVTATSVVEVAGNQFVVYDDDVTPAVGFAQSDAIYVNSNGPVAADLGSGEATFDVAMAIAFGMGREDGYNFFMQYDVFACNAPPSGGNCLSAGTGGGVHRAAARELYTSADSLRIILHELGHAVTASQMATPSQPWQGNGYEWTNDAEQHLTPPYQPADSMCPIVNPASHNLDSDEVTTDAVIEGYATYYYAVVTNRTNETDCFLLHSSKDWDHDDTTAETFGWYSCEQRPTPDLPSTMNRDYWAHECSQSVDNVSSEYDWVRGLWDLDTDEGLTFGQLLQVWVEADPSSWFTSDAANGACDVSQPTGVKEVCPWRRLDEAANTLGLGAEWANQHDNGINR
jgi:hypothetical protein